MAPNAGVWMKAVTSLVRRRYHTHLLFVMYKKNVQDRGRCLVYVKHRASCMSSLTLIVEALETLLVDRGEVDEDVLTPVIGGDEAEALLAEELHLSAETLSLFLAHCEAGDEGGSRFCHEGIGRGDQKEGGGGDVLHGLKVIGVSEVSASARRCADRCVGRWYMM